MVEVGRAKQVPKDVAPQTISMKNKYPIVTTKISGKYMEIRRSIPKKCKVSISSNEAMESGKGDLNMEASIFETHYENYLRQIAKLDFSSMQGTLDIELRGQDAVIPFIGKDYIVSNTGIADTAGNRPDYMICVILSKYLLLCPGTPIINKEWAALKDFHKMSQFTNLNVFTSDAEQPIAKLFSGRLDALSDACQKLGGIPSELSASYDFAMQFNALPRIDILLLFNDGDDDFPAACSVLFQRQAEDYLDPESLIMIGIAFTRRLKRLSN